MIAKVPNMLLEKMLKILLENIFLPDGKLFYVFFILILNILKDLKIPSQISLHMNFCSVTMASRRSKDTTPATNNQIVKKEILSIVLCISKFQSDLLNQNFCYELIAKVLNMLLKKMLKILLQNIFLPDGKLF